MQRLWYLTFHCPDSCSSVQVLITAVLSYHLQQSEKSKNFNIMHPKVEHFIHYAGEQQKRNVG